MFILIPGRPVSVVLFIDGFVLSCCSRDRELEVSRLNRYYLDSDANSEKEKETALALHGPISWLFREHINF